MDNRRTSLFERHIVAVILLIFKLQVKMNYLGADIDFILDWTGSNFTRGTTSGLSCVHNPNVNSVNTIMTFNAPQVEYRGSLSVLGGTWALLCPSNQQSKFISELSCESNHSDDDYFHKTQDARSQNHKAQSTSPRNHKVLVTYFWQSTICV